MSTRFDDVDPAERRTILAKVRLSTTEAREIDRRIKAAGGGTRARYLREVALRDHSSDALAEIIGQISLSLNQLDDAPERRLEHIARQLDQLIFLMRGRDD